MKNFKGLIAGFLFALGIIAGAAVPTAITDLSSTAASNSPSGSENVFPNLDDYLRAGFKFQRDLYDGTLTISGKTFTSPLGTVSAPTYSFTGDTNTGLWSPAADTLAWSIGGAEGARLDGTGFGVGGTAAYKINARASGSNAVVAATSTDSSGVTTYIQGNGSSDGRVGTASAVPLILAPNATPALTLTSDGRMYGSALHNNAGAVTGTTNQYIASGTYTPTLTGVSNITAATGRVTQWMRVGNVVTVSGVLDLNPSLNNTLSEVGISLPIASTFSAKGSAAGFALCNPNSPNQSKEPWSIYADTANARATMKTDGGIVIAGSKDYNFHFTYVIQ